MKHTLSWLDDSYGVTLDYRPVRTRALSGDAQYFPPQARVY